MKKLREFIKLISTVLTSIFTLFTAIKRVNQGEKGLKLTLGVVTMKEGKPLIYGPGPVILFPGVQKLKKIKTGLITLELKSQSIDLGGHFSIEPTAMVVYQVIDPYKALFEVEDLEEIITMNAMEQIYFETQKANPKSINHQLIFDGVLSHLNELGKDWGVNFLRIGFISCTSETTD